MNIPAWEWEARGFDPEADITESIWDALEQDRPEAVFYARWPWLSNAVIEQFVVQAKAAYIRRPGGRKPLPGEDARVLIERFQHTVRAEWSERYAPKIYRRPARRPWWRFW